MKKNSRKIKILIIILLLLITTGCTTTLTDSKKKAVKNEETGQTLTSNILCQPEEKELYELYSKYNNKLQVKLEKLPQFRKI